MTALRAWNADATRMPARMHAEYLRQFYLRNELAEGRLHMDGELVDLEAIAAPMFVVATERDHVSPWRSVYKIHQLVDAPIDFVLASGGHNVAQHTGSWWPAWHQWLRRHSTAARVTARAVKPLRDEGTPVAAPGTYVFQR